MALSRQQLNTRESRLLSLMLVIFIKFLLRLARQRWDNLVREFEIKFGHKPTHVARAPGRVKYVHTHSVSHSSFM